MLKPLSEYKTRRCRRLAAILLTPPLFLFVIIVAPVEGLIRGLIGGVKDGWDLMGTMASGIRTQW